MFVGFGNDFVKWVLKELIDFYFLIFDNNLDVLRFDMKDIFQFDDCYNYFGMVKSFNFKDLQKIFF